MKLIQWVFISGLFATAQAQQIPWGRPDVPISSHDRIYAANQTSNTVSVIDPSTNLLLGVIKLGESIPGSLSPLYKGQLLVHGLGYSPDGKTLAVVSVGSNSVSLIDTASNRVKGTIYVGRSPHEAFFTVDGLELWVTVRGENYISVLDPILLIEKRRIELANEPGMAMFGTDGRYAFVCSSFTPELTVLDAHSYKLLKRLPQAQVFSAKPPFEERALLETGPITNHVNFVSNRNGKFAYVTVGGSGEVKVFQRGGKLNLVATIPVGSLPHGIWPSGDGSRVYVALENGDMAVAIDCTTNQVIANIPIGQTTQALVYAPNAVPVGDGKQNLEPLGEAADTVNLQLGAAGTRLPEAEASAAVNSLGLLDLVQIAAKGLSPESKYQVYLAESNHEPFGQLTSLALLRSNADGAGIVQAIGPLKMLAAGDSLALGSSRRFLIVTELNDRSRVVLRQAGAWSVR